jgi:hypothetical protein
MQPKPKRPTGVTVIAVLNILGGLAGLGLGAIFIAAGALASSSLATQYPTLSSISGISSILYAVGALALIIGILSIVVAVGFLGGKGWAWTLGIVAAVIGIVVGIVEVVIGFLTDVIGIIFQIIILYYLMRPHVKAFFGKGPAMASAMPPPMMSSSMSTGSSAASSMGMTCKNCGATIPAGATRCPSCGANL